MAKKKTKPRRSFRHTPGPLPLDAIGTLFNSSPSAQYLERMKRLQGEPLEHIDPGQHIATDRSLWKDPESPAKLHGGDEGGMWDSMQQQVVHQKIHSAFLHTPTAVETQQTLPGTRASQPAPFLDRFALMDLPPELRKMVLQFTLQNGQTIGIRSHKSSPVYREPRYPIRFPSMTTAYTGLRWNSISNRWTRIPSNNIPSLMRVSKQIREEFAPVIYGDHVFHFRWMDDCHLFLQYIGEMRLYLRRLYLDDFRPAYASYVLPLLTDARDLQSLEFGPRAVLRLTRSVCLTGEHMVLAWIDRAARPLLHGLQAKSAADPLRRTTDPSRLIRIQKRSRCGNCVRGMERSKCTQGVKGFLVGMRNTCVDEEEQVRLVELVVKAAFLKIMRESVVDMNAD
ncbi:hypothetical protein KC367_g5614 [Hortaea werneckii]|nr:hypothetical protein KC367_g5614 [Hortaea werneckii]